MAKLSENPYEHVALLRYNNAESRKRRKESTWNWTDARIADPITPEEDEEEIRSIYEKLALNENYNRQFQAIVDKQLDEGMSFEDISRGTGLDVEEIRKYADTHRPGYGVSEPKSVTDRIKQAKDVVELSASRLSTGIVKDFAGLYDLVSPGHGTNRVTKGFDEAIKGYDEMARERDVEAAYKVGNVVGEVGSYFIPGAVVGKAAKGGRLAAASTKLGKGGTASKIAGEVINPANLATDLYASGKQLGEAAGHGEDISAGRVAGEVGLGLAGAAVPNLARAVDRNFLTATPELKRLVANNAFFVLRQADIAQRAQKAAATKAAKTDPLEALKQEARKYKSAEEFVNSQKAVYHGTNADITDFGQLKGGRERGEFSATNSLFASENPELARAYGKNLLEGRNTGKVLDTTTLGNKLDPNERVIPDEFADYKTNPILEPRDRRVLEESYFKSGTPSNITIDHLPNIQEYFRSKGYSAIQIPRASDVSGKATEMVIIDPSKIRTRQQLTDLYNQAHAEAPQAANKLAKEAAEKVAKTGKKGAKAAGKTVPTSTPSSNLADMGGGETRVVSAAAKAERDAIRSALIPEGIDDVATYETVEGGLLKTLEDRAVAALDNDLDGVVRGLLGEGPLPPDVPAGALYRGALERLQEMGDVARYRQLATSDSTVAKTVGTALGREIAAFGTFNSEESLEQAIRTIQAARKKVNMPNLSDDEVGELMEMNTALKQARRRAEQTFNEGVGEQSIADDYGALRVAYDTLVHAKSSPSYANKMEVALAYARATKQDPTKTLLDITGLSKTLATTLDAPPLFRQGWKLMATHPTKWLKVAKKAVPTYFKVLFSPGQKDGHLARIYAEVASRANALNGMYKRMGVPIYGSTPKLRLEQLPNSDFLNKAPFFRRFTMASEAGFTAVEQYTMAELSDLYLKMAADAGVDLSKKSEVQAIGKLVNALANKSGIDKYGAGKQALNNVFFSPAMMKSNFDVLTAHQFMAGGTSKFTRRQARKNLLKIMATGTAILGTAKLAQEMGINKDLKVDFDPRSANFGRIQVKNTRFDVTGGFAPMATLMARMATGETKSSLSGNVKSLNADSYGALTGEDIVTTFFANKLSPAARTIYDWKFKGEDIDGNKMTPARAASTLTLPLILRNIGELKGRKDAASGLLVMFAEGFGIGTNTYSMSSNWNNSNGKALTAFKAKVGDKKFKEADEVFTDAWNRWYETVAKDESFWKWDLNRRERYVSDKKDELTKAVMEEYGFTYKSEQKSDTQKREEESFDQKYKIR